jgi:two-component system cell cycle sensor histidine kinase/response regulator CckA
MPSLTGPDLTEVLDSSEEDPRLHPMLVHGLSMEQFRSALPDQYAAWVRSVLWVALVGYVVTIAAFLAVGNGLGALVWTGSPFAFVGLLVALAVVCTGRLVQGAQLGLVVIWVQLVGELIVSREGLAGTSTPVLVLLVLVTNLLLGPRWAVGLCAVTSVGVPAALLSGGQWVADTRGLPGRDVPLLVAFVVVMWVTALIQTAFLRAFWTVLRRLRANEARFAAMIDGAPDAMVGLGPDGKVDAFNGAAERALGLKAADVIGKPFSVLPFRTSGGSALETQSGPRELEVVGRDTVLEYMVRRTPGPDRTKRLILVLRDVTARRKAEQRAQELKVQLEHAQRLEAVGRLAGGVAHDFNNLLTAVGGGAAFLQDHADPDVREIATELRAAQERGAALTRQLLSFARKEVTSPKVIDLAAFLERERVLLQRILGERLVLDLDPVGPATVVLDEGQLEQVLLNLTVNARDAMDDQGTLYVGCRVEDGSVVLVVRDTGSGMTEDVRQRLFEPFFTTKGTKGTGLGLSTVHGIVSNAGGTIHVDSQPGRGAEFHIRLPWVDAAPASVAKEPPVSERRRARILLVEDDDLTRDFARRALVRMGHEVEVARNGAEALDRVARDRPFDLVLSDVTMPVMTGPELLGRLREQGVQVPVLLMSGYVDDVLREGIFDVTTQLLLKPFSMEELSRRVNETLQAAG